MSAPMVEYGQCVWMLSVVVGSGSNEMSKGCADISLVCMCFRSMSSLVVVRIYPAVANAGCSASAQESRIMLCANFLFIFVQLKV